MANNLYTVFQRLGTFFNGGTVRTDFMKDSNVYQIKHNDVIDTAKSPEEYQMKKLQAKQQTLIAKQWKKATYDINNQTLSGLNEIKLMYRDSELMDGFPEIGTALDIFSEEACVTSEQGFMVNVNSKSDRIKSILNDLFVNRLSINIILPMICRAMCKYGNNYMLLNIDKDNGIMGWKQLPVYEMERYENGTAYPYVSAPSVSLNNVDETKTEDTKFVWVGQTEYIPYRSWQIAHFRLLYDSQFLPYGVSVLNKARRHFRMLSMMEDMMLIYRLDRSIERRIFKINVGAIDTEDVPAYVQEIANNFKRTPIIDPMTGQIDLRKNIMCNTEDFFIPVRDSSEPSPIETLPAGQNLTAMDDIKFIQNKLFTALRVPKSFLNFEETTGDGKNLSLMDVRFTRTTNRIQQALLMELNKIAMIHLFLLGFTDEITDFTLTMNNPSSQAEMLELENLAKKITTAKDAVSDPGGGIPLTSMTWAWRHIMKWSDKEIQRNLEEIRLEFALAAELTKTSQIIKRTKLFDPVDNIYGESGAEYSEDNPNEEGGPDGGAPGGGGGMPIGGGDMDFGDGAPGDDMEQGAEGEMPMEDAANEDMGNMGANDPNGGAIPPMGESVSKKLKLLTEIKQEKYRQEMKNKSQHYMDILCERLLQKTIDKENESKQIPKVDFDNKILLINEEMTKTIEQLRKYETSEQD